MTAAVLDACVLYPPALRDLLTWLAVHSAYQPRWTEEIHAEWMRSVLSDHPELTPLQLERTRRLMDHIDEESPVCGYEAHIPRLSLPDPNDRHVLAAAIAAKASVIVTYNLADFPASALRRHGIRAVHPDAFLCDLLDGDPERFFRALRAHRASLKKPPKTPHEYLETLRTNRLTKLAARLEAHLGKY